MTLTIETRKLTSLTDIRRVLILGDTHGDSEYLNGMFNKAVRLNCDAIFVVGDFGYWEHTQDGRRFLDVLSRFSARHAMQLIWLDGNHENHTMLNERYVKHHMLTAARRRVTPAPFIQIRPGVWYAWRGARWAWGKHTFIAVGGAYSVDKGSRTEDVDWWPGEEMSEGQLHRILCSAGWDSIDVMLCHDIPMGVELPRNWKDKYPAARPNRHRLRVIMEQVAPKLLIHGHMHYRYTDTLVLDNGRRTSIEGLASNVEGRKEMGNQPWKTYLVMDLNDSFVKLERPEPRTRGLR